MPMATTVEQLIKQLPADTESRVEKARRRWNPLLRTILRSESRLLLKRIRETEAEQEEEAVAVPVSIGLIQVARELLLVTLKNCRIHLPTWFAGVIRWHESDGL
jgi:hypothetical protein